MLKQHLNSSETTLAMDDKFYFKIDERRIISKVRHGLLSQKKTPTSIASREIGG